MQGPQQLKVGEIFHLEGTRVNPDTYQTLGPACVPGIVSHIDGDELYATAFNSPKTLSDGFAPLVSEWHSLTDCPNA